MCMSAKTEPPFRVQELVDHLFVWCIRQQNIFVIARRTVIADHPAISWCFKIQTVMQFSKILVIGKAERIDCPAECTANFALFRRPLLPPGSAFWSAHWRLSV